MLPIVQIQYKLCRRPVDCDHDDSAPAVAEKAFMQSHRLTSASQASKNLCGVERCDGMLGNGIPNVLRNQVVRCAITPYFQ